jgi:hypothetical protein
LALLAAIAIGIRPNDTLPILLVGHQLAPTGELLVCAAGLDLRSAAGERQQNDRARNLHFRAHTSSPWFDWTKAP